MNEQMNKKERKEGRRRKGCGEQRERRQSLCLADGFPQSVLGRHESLLSLTQFWCFSLVTSGVFKNNLTM